MESFIANNLKKLLELSHISASELSRLTGIKQPIIHRLISGENINPKLATLKPIADYFMVTVSELIGEKEICSIWEGYTTNLHKGWNKTPLIPWNQIIIPFENRNFKSYVLINRSINDNTYALLIEDESMTPVFTKNSIAIIEPNQSPTELDYILVKLENDEIAIRQLITISEKQYITPLNRKGGKINILNSVNNILGVVVQILYDPRVILKDTN